MPKRILISDEAMQAVAAAAQAPFKQTAHRTPSGMWSVRLDFDILKRLEELRFEGESDSDLIIRVIGTSTRPLQ